MSYEKIVNYYDYIFPLNQVTLRFLESSFPAGSRILDVGCGSGEYAVGLADSGFQVYGLDLDSDMITKAKAKSQNLKIEFTVGSMTQLTAYYENEHFSGIFCIGNSLAHVADHKQLIDVCSQFYNLLANDGRLVLQIINYDRIINKKLPGLPTIENSEHGVRFERYYEFELSKIKFKTILHADGKSESSEVLLYAVCHDELIQALSETGFTDIETYGNFALNPFNLAESQPLIIRCRK